MKNCWRIVALCGLSVLCGCTTVSETEIPPVESKLSSGIALRLEGFQLTTLRPSLPSVGISANGGYRFNPASWLLSGGPYVGSKLENLPDQAFTTEARDLFESVGANIRSAQPALIVEGRIGSGHYIWDLPATWYRDVLLLPFRICTLGGIASYERENSVKLIIYHQNGKKLKEYNAVARYYAFSIGLPLAFLANDKMTEAGGDRNAAKIALIGCINEFVRDCNAGLFNAQPAPMKNLQPVSKKDLIQRVDPGI